MQAGQLAVGPRFYECMNQAGILLSTSSSRRAQPAQHLWFSMLRAPAQDENAGPRMTTVSKQGASLGSDVPPSLKGAGLRPRLALSNISNGPRPAPAAPAGKQAAPTKLGRRALGDITNAQREQSKAPASDTLKPAMQSSAPTPSSAQLKLPTDSGTHMPAMRSLAEQYAADGVEKLAGKSWDQQEAERQQQQAAWAAARLKLFMQMPTWRPHVVGVGRVHVEGA